MTEIFPVIYPNASGRVHDAANPPSDGRVYPETPERLSAAIPDDYAACPLCEGESWWISAVDVLMQIVEAPEIAAVLNPSQRAAVERVKNGAEGQ